MSEIKFNSESLAFLRELIPVGTYIRLEKMEQDFMPVPCGSLGVVEKIDDAGQIHCRWDNGSGLAVIPGIDHFSVVSEYGPIAKKQTEKEVFSFRFYMPLLGTIERGDGGMNGEDEDSRQEITGDKWRMLSYKGDIDAALLRLRCQYEDGGNMMQFFTEANGVAAAVRNKVKAYYFTTAYRDGILWGVADCHLYEALTQEEIACLKEDIEDHAADGFGESFSQTEIPTRDGSLYVSFWSKDPHWCVKAETELWPETD